MTFVRTCFFNAFACGVRLCSNLASVAIADARKVTQLLVTPTPCISSGLAAARHEGCAARACWRPWRERRCSSMLQWGRF
jgi:hypothetical protein